MYLFFKMRMYDFITVFIKHLLNIAVNKWSPAEMPETFSLRSTGNLSDFLKITMHSYALYGLIQHSPRNRKARCFHLTHMPDQKQSSI